MATDTPLIERADIHKSCKALETIVNVFNDYCQAAESLALEQKKLARALKDAVELKATNELAGNALNAVATLLESLAEVDAKFIKVADKECEGSSNDLKKWFKKLAKEEKNHDNRIAAANAKIKQAGQTYEKKAKKKDGDAVEEHTRYVNLLSVLGPEMSQEKQNHALLVTQRHTSTLYSVVSSVSRTADAEWARACECVRRFAPVIGRIGECRAYLEGGWMAALPEGGAVSENGETADVGVIDEVESKSTRKVDEMGVRIAKAAPGSAETHSLVQRLNAPVYAPATSISSSTPLSSASSSRIPLSLPQPQSLDRTRPAAPPPTSYFPTVGDKLNTDSIRSIESLSSFPAPPAHFPLPNMAQLPVYAFAQTKFSEQPKRDDGERNGASMNSPIDASTSPQGRALSAPAPIPMSESPGARRSPVGHSTPALTDDSGRSPLSNEPLTPFASPDVETRNSKDSDMVKINPPAHSPEQRRRDSAPQPTSDVGARDWKGQGMLERSESVASTSSIVASMRDRWSRVDAPSSSSTRERDIPRVPNKVSDLANRYTPAMDPSGSAPLSPRSTGQGLPTNDRARQFSGPHTPRDENFPATRTIQGAAPAPAAIPAPTVSDLDFARRRQRIEELEELERREHTQALHAREREVELRVRELEREREHLRMFGSASATNLPAVTAIRAHPQHSYSMTNLVSPRQRGEAPARPVSQYGEPLVLSASQSSSSSNSIPQPRPDHAPYCGCYSCSATQYSVQPAHVQARPEKEREKPKGWMRRLSMPVVSNAFSSSSSDSKKSYGSGVGISSGRAGYGPPIEGPLKHFGQDGTGGISNVNNTRSRKLSFGKR